MKQLLLLLLLATATLQAKELGVDANVFSPGIFVRSVPAKSKAVIFIIDTDVTLAIESQTGSGDYSNTFTAAGGPVIFTAPQGDTLNAINFKVTAGTGTVRYIRIQ